uniref:Uncharacterized protein n=1 Tax=Setaria italica TaxID=4555 RepID=K3Y0P5_SETIT
MIINCNAECLVQNSLCKSQRPQEIGLHLKFLHAGQKELEILGYLQLHPNISDQHCSEKGHLVRRI